MENNGTNSNQPIFKKFETAIAMYLSISLYSNFHLNNHKQTQNKMYVNKDA